MADHTTRLNLYLPGGGSTGTITPDEVADIDKLNQNFRDIDGAIGALGVTSTTRPPAPFNGQIIRESDTKNTLIWDGTTWQQIVNGAIIFTTLVARNSYAPSKGDNCWVDETQCSYTYNGTFWLPISQRAYIRMNRGAQTGYADGATVVVRGDGQSTPNTSFLGVPTSLHPLTLTTDTYDNEFFTWNRNTGVLKVKRAGKYRIEFAVVMAGAGTGSTVMVVTKNDTVGTIGTNMLARDERSAATGGPAGWLRSTASGIALVPTDDVRLVLNTTGIGGTLQWAHQAFPTAVSFEIALEQPS